MTGKDPVNPISTPPCDFSGFDNIPPETVHDPSFLAGR